MIKTKSVVLIKSVGEIQSYYLLNDSPLGNTFV